MPNWRIRSGRSTPCHAFILRGVHGPRQSALAVPLSTLPAHLEHGALGVWDEVAVGVLLVGCAVAYGVWFYVSGRREKPHD